MCTISVFFLPERTFHGQIEILPNFNIFTTLIRYQPWHIQFKGKKNENYIKKMSINVHGQRSKWVWVCVCVCAGNRDDRIMNIKLLFKSCHSNRITISIGSKFCASQSFAFISSGLPSPPATTSSTHTHTLSLFLQTTSIRASVHSDQFVPMLPVSFRWATHTQWWCSIEHLTLSSKPEMM